MTLLDDIDLGYNGYWGISSDNVTIDLNGHTLTGDNTYSWGVLYLTGDDPTVKNGTVVTLNSTYKASYAIFMQVGSLTLENVTTKTAPSVGELQTVLIWGHATIKGGSYQGLRIGVDSSAELHDGARFTPGADNKEAGALKFSITRDVYVHPDKSTSCMGFLAPNCAYVRDNGQPLFSHSGITETVTVKANTATPTVPVAQILRDSEPLRFITLDDAIDAVQDGETIQLLNDLDLGTGRAWVNVGKRFTLDLNGKTLSSYSGDVICMGDTASVDLTIKNGFIKGMIHVSNLNATVTLDGITATNGDDYSIVVLGGKVIILSGDYTGVWLESVNNGEKELYGQLLLTGGTFRKPNHPDQYALYNDGVESPILTDFLGDGCLFWDGDTTNILRLTQSSTVDVVTVRSCQHSWGTDGKCAICGVDCPHTVPNSKGSCDTCGHLIVAQVMAEGTETSYYVALSQALEAAAKVGGTATMLRPSTLEDEYSFPVGTYTLDMNGHPLNLYQEGDTIRDLVFPEGTNVTIRSSANAVLDSRLKILGGDLTLSGPITLCANIPSTDDIYGCRLDYMSGDGSIYSSSLTLTKTDGSSFGPTLNCNVFVSGLSQSSFFGTLKVEAGTINKNVFVSAGHLDVLSDDVEFGPNSEVTLRFNAILTATGGSFRGKVYFDYYSDWYGTKFGKGNISGGEFANISCHENLSLATDKLAAGYAFANQSDGSLITLDGSTRQLYNVKVVPCSHETFDPATGRCPCGQQLYVAAQAEYSNGKYTILKGYATFEEAAAAPFVRNSVHILLLDDVTMTQDATISTWVILQGHTLTVNASLTTSGRGTLKGDYTNVGKPSTVDGTGQVIIGQSSDVAIDSNISLKVPVTVYGSLLVTGGNPCIGFESLTMKGGKLELFNASIGQLVIESGTVLVYDTYGSVPNGSFRDVQVKGGTLTISADRSNTVVNRFNSITASGGTVNFSAGILNSASLTAASTGVINLNGGSRADMSNVTVTASDNGIINVNSGEFKGVTSAGGNVTIRGGTFAELQNTDNAPAVNLLANGYCFRRSDNSWVPSTEEAAALQNVTATTAPLTNVVAKATPDTIRYGDASPVLSVGFSAVGAVTYQWYQDDTAIEGATASSYTLPDKLDVGQYTYHAALTSEGCTVRSNDVTVTVNKADPVVTAPTPIQGLTFSGSAEPLVYEGSTTGGTMLYSLSQAGPYTATIPVGADAGTYSVWYKVEGNDNYNDAAPSSVEVTIRPRTIDSDDVDARTEDSLAYTGKALTPVPTAVYKGKTLEYGKDFTAAYANNTAAGTATVTLTGIGNFHFTKTLTFAITPAAITNVSVAQKGSLTYTGTPQSAQAAASADTVDGCAVTFTYSAARDGSYGAMPTFTGAGSYTVYYKAEAPNHEAVIDSFTVAIQPRSITDAAITLGDTLTYNGKAQTQTVKSVVVDGITLPAKDYTVTGNRETDAGKTYTLTVSDANGNLTGTADATWSIARKDIEGAVITLGDALTYNGKEQAQAVKSVVIDDLSATFDVTNNTGTDAGEDYTLTVSGTGNFTGTASAPFSIARKDISAAVIAATLGDALIYNGRTQTQTVSAVAADGLTIPEGTYTVTGNTGKEAGSYTMTITADSGNFTGAATAPFPVNKAVVEPQDTALSVVNGYARDYTVDLAALLPGLKALERYGVITYGAPVVALDSGYYAGGAGVSASGLLTLPIARNDVSTDSAVGTVTVTVSSDNFEDFDLTIHVSAENKVIPTGAPKLSRNWLRYGESLSAIRLSGSMRDGMNTVRGTFQWAEPHFTPTSDTVTAEWVFIPRDTERYASVTGTAVITVKDLPEDIYTVLGTVVYTEGAGNEPIAPVIGANVTIQVGNRIFSRTTTDENGSFSLAGVPSGQYNVVVTVNTMPRKTVTAKLTVTAGAGQQVSMDTIRVRTEDVNSRLSISDSALDVVVGGLDQLAEKRFDSDGAITDLTVDMTVEKPAYDRGDALQNALRTALKGKTLELLELGLTLTSGGDAAALTRLAEDEALELIVPYDTSRRSIVVYRAALDDQGDAAVTEVTVQIDTVSGCLRLTLDQPGLYAIGYKARTTSGGGSDTNQTGTADAAKDGVKSADTGDNGVVLYAALAFITPLGGVKLLRGKRRREDD